VTTSFPRLIAATLLLAGGGIVAISAFALVVARIVIAAGLPVSVSPSDVALVDDLVQLVPFIGAFAVANLVAAVALVAGSAWADRLATIVAAGAVGIALFGMILLVLGHDPLASAPSDHALTGLQVLGAFAGLYGAVVVALAFDGKAAVVSNPSQAAA
jgi:hypothetical protein